MLTRAPGEHERRAAEISSVEGCRLQGGEVPFLRGTVDDVAEAGLESLGVEDAVGDHAETVVDSRESGEVCGAGRMGNELYELVGEL